MNDPIADILIRIKNASLSRQPETAVPYSRLKESLSQLLKKEGFLSEVTIVGVGPKRTLILTLIKQKNKIRTIEVKRISKLGRRIYASANQLPALTRGIGTVVISTPLGLMTAGEAVSKKIGGEIICQIK